MLAASNANDAADAHVCAIASRELPRAKLLLPAINSMCGQCPELRTLGTRPIGPPVFQQLPPDPLGESAPHLLEQPGESPAIARQPEEIDTVSGDDRDVPWTAGQLGPRRGGTGCYGCVFHHVIPFHFASRFRHHVLHHLCRRGPILPGTVGGTSLSAAYCSGKAEVAAAGAPTCGAPAATSLPLLPTRRRPRVSGTTWSIGLIRTAPDAACLSGYLCRAPAGLSALRPWTACAAALPSAGPAPPRSVPEPRQRRAGPP